MTGSLEDVTLSGSFGKIYALSNSDITVSGSTIEEMRLTLLSGDSFLDTQQKTTEYSIEKIKVWGQGEVLVYGIGDYFYSSSLPPTPPPTPPTSSAVGAFYIGGQPLSQILLNSKLTGETLVGYANDGSNTWATSSTNYTINNSGFNNEFLSTYIDNGYCTGIASFAFDTCTDLVEVKFPGVTLLGDFTFTGCSNLSLIDVRSCTSFGLNCFDSVSPTGTITVKLGMETDPEVVSLTPAGGLGNNWTIITV